MVLQLGVLAAAAYIYAVAELAPIGAMPSIAVDLHVSQSRVGMLTAAYALISVLTTVPMVRWTARWPRRRVLVLTLVSLTASQLLSALAPGLVLLAASRVLCALTHGLMWSIIAPIGARLVPASHTARATTAVYVGTSAALIIGNPLTASMSQAWGWRPAVLVVAVVAGVVTVLARWCLPVLNTDSVAGQKNSLHIGIGDTRLLTLCVITLIGVTAHFASYTFVVPIVGQITGADGRGQAVLLAAYGAVGLVSMTVLARSADRRPRTSISVTLAVLCSAFVVLASTASGGAAVPGTAAILIWGGCAAVLPPMLQAAVIKACPQYAERASAWYVTAFQIGIVAGSVGGGAVYGNHGVLPVVAMSAVLFAVTLAAFVSATRRVRVECPARPRWPADPVCRWVSPPAVPGRR